jgi:transposase
MISQSQPFQHIIAFEVAKESLTVQTLPSDRQETIANTAAAVRRVLRREIRFNAKMNPGPMLVVCEATGGYERHVLAEAAALGLALHRAHGVRTRYFARYLGLAKTDPIDARMLALYGRDTPKLRLYAPPQPYQAELVALRKRRDDIKTMMRMEANRLEHALHPSVVASIKISIKAYDRSLAGLDAEIERLIESNAELARKANLMQTVKGVGPATAAACLAYLPELGSFSKGQVARIVGLAPIANDSGKASMPRHIAGGRKTMRSALYMAALVAISTNPRISRYARQLRQRGKPAKLVITAVMRKLVIILNAIIRDDTPAFQNP